MINHKLLCLLEGKCWHEWEGGWSFPGGQHDYKCKKCGLIIPLAMLQDLHLPIPVSPDYSSPNTYLPFLQWFWKEREVMWYSFTFWAYTRKCTLPDKDAYYVWLYSLTPDNEPRIMVLLSEWLSLPETRKIWGWEECPECEGKGDVTSYGVNKNEFYCQNCNGTGRIKAEWAKEG
ncbi:MAG: hypothetical protein ABFD82_18355 [Syntrophaceae bacterium]